MAEDINGGVEGLGGVEEKRKPELNKRRKDKGKEEERKVGRRVITGEKV